MPRQSRTPLFPIALSPLSLAAALGVAPAVIYSAMRAGELKGYQRGRARRILTLDAAMWVADHWNAIKFETEKEDPCHG